MATITATVQFLLSAIEKLADIAGAAESTIQWNQFGQSLNLSATSTPPVSQVFAEEFTGSQNLDLTALVRSLGDTLDATGKKVQAMLLNNLSEANEIVLADNVATPYSLNDGDPITLPPGGRALFYWADQLADVAAGAKLFDVTATAGQSFQIMLLIG